MPTFVDGTLVHQGDLNLLSAGINNLSTYLMGSPAPRATIPQAVLRQTVAQPMNTGTDYLVTFDAADSNTDGMWVSSVRNQLTIQTAGTYEINATVALNTGASDLFAFILLNGTSTTANVVCEDHKPGMVGADGQTMHVQALLASLAVGAVIYLDFYHNAGSTLTPPINRACARINARRTGP